MEIMIRDGGMHDTHNAIKKFEVVFTYVNV